jgi:hypothetical protein
MALCFCVIPFLHSFETSYVTAFKNLKIIANWEFFFRAEGIHQRKGGFSKHFSENLCVYSSAFSALLHFEIPKDSATLTLDKSIVQQDVGYIIWQATTPKFKLTFGTDTFIIQNGKIIRQTYAGVVSPL